ncbi:MAG: serine/threonine-protein kinase, partial [Polyangiaceae bacterium]
VLDYGVHENTPFLVMELLQGQSLAECLEREQRLTPERTVSVITQVARAIGRAHAAGIVHRDLKPDNIFLINEDGQELAKVLDFGIAKTTGPRFGGMETRTGVTMGTPYYMSPEQVEGKKALDHRADLWSLAVIACECLTGVRPFDGETYGELLLNICARPIAAPSSTGFRLPGFDEWFAKAANRDMAQRFNSAQEMASALADVVAGRAAPSPLTAPQASGPDATLPMNSPTLLFTGNAIAASTAPGLATSSATHLATHVPTDPGRAGVAQWAGPPPPKKQGAVVAIALGGLIGLLLLVAVILAIKQFGTRAGVSEDPSQPEVLALPSAKAASSALLELTPSMAVSAAPSPTPTPKSAPAAAAAEAKPATPSITLPAVPALPVIQTPPPSPAPPRAPAGQRCFADPFTGQVRVANAAHTADSFPCKQNPFTGAFQRQ